MSGRVAVVIVTHHSAAVIGACLDSVRDVDQLIVVDNASDDETRQIVAQKAPAAEVLHNAVGVGYGNGANQGLARVACEFALMVNPDSVLRPDAIAELLAAAERYPEAAMFGPTLLKPSGEVELSHDVSLFERRRYGKRDGESPPVGDCSAASLSGAVVLLRMAALKQVGFFDSNLFLYYDDDDMCMRLGAAGYGLVLAPAAVAEHRGAGSVRPSPGYYWEKFWHMAWSRLYMEEKYHGPAAMRRMALGNGLRYAAKTIAHTVTLNRHKAWRDAARTSGAIAYLAGVPALRDNLRS
ncbi:MAG: glycosyltransferase family 2 protein [Planctomycetes bacterium]|nr:glycosyltransferase family 2 protein [Planctomycetota bacterium]